MPTFSSKNYGFNLEVSQESFDVTGLEPDPEWEFTDQRGHVHRYEKKGGSFLTPTLERVVEVEEERCGECGCTHNEEVSHLACRECGDEVRPGMKYPEERKAVLGLRTIKGDIPRGSHLYDEIMKGDPFELREIKTLDVVISGVSVTHVREDEIRFLAEKVEQSKGGEG